MGIISIICSNCGGKGTIQVEGGEAYLSVFTTTQKTCTDCNGEGTQLVHTGSIHSYKMEVYPSGANEDETWQTVWNQHDDGSMDVVDMFCL